MSVGEAVISGEGVTIGEVSCELAVILNPKTVKEMTKINAKIILPG
jgi:hypothetical protein